MTPMVDVAFLLLTFFMLSTTLSTPQVMEISLPPDSKVSVEVAESNLLTIRVRKDEAVFWNKGKDNPTKITAADVPKVLEQRLRENPKTATLIKIDRDAKYQKLVDLIDELNRPNAAVAAPTASSHPPAAKGRPFRLVYIDFGMVGSVTPANMQELKEIIISTLTLPSSGSYLDFIPW